MKLRLLILLALSLTFACKNANVQEKGKETHKAYQTIINTAYELYKPTQNSQAVLVLFGGYGETAQAIKNEFKVLDIAQKNDIALLLLNDNNRLWLTENEKLQLTEQLIAIFKNNQLPTDNVYIGGFSSGGNIALLISNVLCSTAHSALMPKGVFIIDSPIDLATLYGNAEKNIARNFSTPAVQESMWLIEALKNQFGNPNNALANYEKHAVFTLKTNNIDNVKALKNTKIRLYTEPDTLWWKKNRMYNYKEMNAYMIKKLAETLHENNFTKVEYIPTENRGYRANGERHPHSWAIVDAQSLVNWILSE
jgi:hypothetical protein